MEKETRDKILGCFDTAGSDALATGDHAWGSTPWDSQKAREHAIKLLKGNFSETPGEVLKEVVNRGVAIKRGAYKGNVGQVLDNMSAEGQVGDILEQVFEGHDVLASFRRRS